MDEQNTQHKQTASGEGDDASRVETGAGETVAPTGQSPSTMENGDEKTSQFSPTYIGAVLFGALLIASALWYTTGDRDLNLLNFGGQTETGTQADYPDVVATVDGIEISGEQLSAAVAQTAQSAVAQGLDPNDPEIQAQIEENALTVLINTQVLIQAARDSGIYVTDEEIDSQIVQLETQFGGTEALQARMDELGMDIDGLRADIEEQILVEAYIQQTDEYKGVVVTPEELQTTYDAVSGSGQEVPPFAEVSEQIEAGLLAQKQQAAASDLVQRLRDSSDIKIKL